MPPRLGCPIDRCLFAVCCCGRGSVGDVVGVVDAAIVDAALVDADVRADVGEAV